MMPLNTLILTNTFINHHRLYNIPIGYCLFVVREGMLRKGIVRLGEKEINEKMQFSKKNIRIWTKRLISTSVLRPLQVDGLYLINPELFDASEEKNRLQKEWDRLFINKPTYLKVKGSPYDL